MRADIVFSIDFELRWGVHDVLGGDFDGYRRNLEGVREVVPATLELFAARGVRATWAIVGAIACEGWDEWLARAPPWPRYLDRRLGWFDTYRQQDPGGRLYFAPDLVERVRSTPGQELGSHTFSHVYLGEPGLVRRDAVADTVSVLALFRERWGFAPTSFVFPRNQVAFADVLAEHGFDIWRDNPGQFHWSLPAQAQETLAFRMLRLADDILPLGARSTPRDASVHRASHFVRFNLPAIAWKAHLHRLVREASALPEGSQLHLWWHPHNLGADPRGCVQRLETLLDALREHAPGYARFSSMRDVASSTAATTS